MGGSSTLGQAGVYGTLGSPGADNFPGCRESAAASTDASGHLWLFGGEGCAAAGDGIWLNDLWEFDPSANEWTWRSGSSTVNCQAQPCGESGVYGTLGKAAPGNVPGGRLGASSWVDGSGNFWLFGGEGYDAKGDLWNLNDLWEFNTSTGLWTWIGGSQLDGPSGQPGAYGKLETAAATNVPGSRYLANSWTDSGGHFWLFGGYGTDANTNQGPLNDVWQFDPSSQQWTWMGGSSTLVSAGQGNPGVYGSLGVPASGNIPGGRYFAAGWTDIHGNFWLFGGNGSNATAGSLDLNDLWAFNPVTNQWTWMSGSSSVGGLTGVYGTKGIFSSGNTPGARETPAGWSDNKGNIWLFGGFGVFGNANGDLGYFNDLWEFNPTAGEWAWMDGSNTVPQIDGGNPGVYGTLGTPALANVPGSRYSAVSWTDSNGNLWLFGGIGDGSDTNIGFLDDLWEYQLSTPLPAAASPFFDVSSGNYTSTQSVTISDATPNPTIYYTTDGTAPTTSSTQYTTPLIVSQTETVQAIAVAPGYSVSPIASATYNIVPPPAATPTFSVPSGTYTSVQNVYLSDATPAAGIYYTTDGTTPTTSSTQYTAPITVGQTETIQAIAVVSGYANSNIASATYTINLPPPAFSLTSSASTLSINSGSQGNLTLTVTPQNGFNSAVTFACSGLPSGATCSFSPSSVTPTGSAAITTELTIAASASASAARPARNPFLPAAGLALAGCLLVFTRRRALRLWLILLAAIAIFGAFTACGGGGSNGGGGGGGIQPTTATVTVTATSGNLQQSTKITLTVS
jgi:N-acetylneuraminic acid mutarotase